MFMLWKKVAFMYPSAPNVPNHGMTVNFVDMLYGNFSSREMPMMLHEYGNDASGLGLLYIIKMAVGTISILRWAWWIRVNKPKC